MHSKIYIRIWTILALLILSGDYSRAQVSLVKWENFSFGPPIPATSYLPMNDGKVLTGDGQSAPQGVPTLFVTSAGAPTDPIFSSNGWNNGAGNAYFIFNFATSNYGNNQVTFIFGIMGEFCPRNYQAQYSTGSSSGPWTNFGSPIDLTGTVPTTGLSVNPTYTLPAACDDQTNVWVRIITTDNGLPSGHTGGPYIDNIDVSGTANAPASITGQPSNSTVCEGIGTSFSVTASNAVSYQWQLDTGSGFSNISNSATYSGATNSTLTIGQTTASMDGYLYRCIVSGGTPPDATSNSAELTVHAYGTWNGSVSSDWNNAANWDCGQVPTITTNVTIPAIATSPVINTTGAICNNLNVLSGGNLAFSGTGELEIKGDINIAGVFDPSNGSVIFSGSTSQVIPGAIYNDLTVNSSGGKILDGAVTVNATLSLMLGTIALNNFNLTIGSSGNISGGSSSSFIETGGSGQLIQQGIGSGGRTGSITFPIGSTATSYTPLILNNSGTMDDFSTAVKNQLFEDYTGNVGSGSAQSNDAVNKTWFINEGTPGGSDVNLQLSWNTSDELPGFDRVNCFLAHYTGSSWNLPATPSTALGAGPFFIARDNLTTFSPFGVTGTGSPLPLELLTFEGTLQNKEVLLTWSTTRESAPEQFHIERSLNGKDFKSIGTVKAAPDQNEQNYEFTDTEIGQRPTSVDVAYYRLKMKKTSEQTVYSNIIKITFPATAEAIRIYPNPVRDGLLHIKPDSGLPEELQLRITDINGKVVRKILIRPSGQKMDIPVQQFQPGHYILTLSDEESDFSQSIPFIIE